MHNWPSMIGNGYQPTFYLSCTVYCHCMLCCCRVSNTRLVQMLCTGYVLYGALARGHVLIKGTFSRIADMHESNLASYIEATLKLYSWGWPLCWSNKLHYSTMGSSHRVCTSSSACRSTADFTGGNVADHFLGPPYLSLCIYSFISRSTGLGEGLGPRFEVVSDHCAWVPSVCEHDTQK